MCGFEDYFVSAPAAAPKPAPTSGPPAQQEPAAAAAPAPEPAPEPEPVIDVVSIVNQAVGQVDLPLPEPHLGPEPGINEWNMLAVGLPVWLWTDEPPVINASVTQQGIPVTLIAHRVRTEVTTGDGTTLSCKTATPRPTSAEPMAASPDCGHTWMKAGTYDVTANTTWAVEWQALGQAGMVTMSRSASRSVEVGELESVVTR
ncbi:hypothetical protein [Luteococcus sp. OSA5]|uniref:hypothetical protein n=1 Tax=Luteococcus sp. OSA5 TaxID=3401630 RepID=UPI003B434065